MKLAAPSPSKVVGETLVGFQLGEAHCAVPIHVVREILNEGPLTTVPTSDPSILGVADVRGEVLLVLDPCQLIGLPRSGALPRKRRWLVLDVEGKHVAWLVDGVTDVFVSARSNAGEGGTVPFVSEWLSWIAKKEKKLVFVLDVRTLATSVRRARASLPPGEGI